MLAKKSLGQNFIHNAKLGKHIVAAAELSPSDIVVEVGPGKGILTTEILVSGATVYAIEKDTDLIPYLSDKFAEAIATRKLTLIHGDALTFNPNDYGLSTKDYKIIGNIPFYITGFLLRHLLTLPAQPTSITVILQKEVADRIVVKDGKESLLSLSVWVYGTPRYITTIKRGSFTPPPNVDAALITITNIGRTNFENAAHEKAFFKLIKAAFAHKRKQMANNIVSLYDTEVIGKVFSEEQIPIKVRAEDVSLEQFLNLSKKLQ